MSKTSKDNPSTKASEAPEKKKNPIFLIIALFVLAMICIPYLYYTILINNYGNAHAPDGYNFPNFKDFWKVILGAVVTQTVRGICHFFMPSIYILIAKGDDEATRQKYALKATEHTYRVIYFSAAAYWGWNCLKDSPYLYESLGGPVGGDLLAMSFQSIYFKYDQMLLDYSYYTFGFHFGNFIQHAIFDDRGTDFMEMMIHHLAANCLFFCYIFGNFITFGAIVAYLHDLADVPANLGKVLSSTTFEKFAMLDGIVLIICWGWTRIYILPKIIYGLTQSNFVEEEYRQFQPYITLCAVFLTVMCALHYFWFAMFFKIAGRFLTTGKATDLGNRVEKKDQ